MGAAVADDVIGLIILSVVRDLGKTWAISWGKAALTAALAVAFFAGAIIIGGIFARQLVRVIERMRSSGALVVGAFGFALTLALAAEWAGLAAIVGAFAAGLALGRTHKSEAVAAELKPVSFIFTPIFFVLTGAAVNIRYFNPLVAANRPVLTIAGFLLLIAVGGKFAAGFAAFGRGIRRGAVGVGMAPRGEVDLIFAALGRRMGVLSPELFAALVLVIALSTFFTAPLLKFAFAERPARKSIVAWFFEPIRRKTEP